MNGLQKLPLRLAFRREGAFINCYFAERETMASALHVGSLATTLSEKPGVFDRWRVCMQECFADFCEDVLGVRPTFPEPPQPAPDHERAGHG